MKPKAYYKAVATLTGCIIGAGIFGIPYVLVRAGFWTGMLVIFVLGLVMLLLNLLVGEISLRTKKGYQLVGYAEKYLGKKGKYFMGVAMVVGVYGSLIAYTLGVSQSLSIIFGGSQWLWILGFYGLMCILLYGGLRIFAQSELLMEAFKYILFLVILSVLFSSDHFSAARYVGFSWDKIFLPYGIILFAYLGVAAIPEIREETKKCPIFTKRVIVTGFLISIATYALFALAIVGVTGSATSEVATIGVAELIGGASAIMLHLFAILAMTSSFVALGYALKETYHVDLKMSHFEAWALTIVIPIVLILIGVQSFVRTLEFAGSFAGGIAAITLILIHAKARKKCERKPEYQIKLHWVVYAILIGLFTFGIIRELLIFL